MRADVSAENDTASPTRAVALALAVAAGWHALVWAVSRWAWPPPAPCREVSWGYWIDGWTLVLGVALVLPAPRRSGLVLGRIGEHWRRVLLVCGVPIALTAAVYPFLPTRPWGECSSSMWTVSPLAQDLVFFGCVYRLFDGAFRGRPVAQISVGRPLLWTAVVFAAWHLPNLLWLPAGYVVFQLCYVFAGACVVGLARQWTGSLVYGWVTHSAINAIAWAAA